MLLIWQVIPSFAVGLLAGVLLWLSPTTSILQLGVLFCILGLAIVSVVTFLLKHHRVVSLGIVEGQLEQLANSNLESTSSKSIMTLLGNSHVAAGWNLLAERLRERRWNESIEQSLLSNAEGSSHDIVYRMARCHIDGLAITDRQGIIRFSNPAWAMMVNLDEKVNTTGHSIFEHLKLENKSGGKDIRDRLQHTSCPATHVVHLGRNLADGVWRLARIPLDGRAHDPEAFVWILRDHTQQALAEEARDRFVGAATHELRTPLANILAYSETLANAEMDPDSQREFFNTISAEAQRLNRLLDQLLNLQQMEAGSLTLDRAPCDLLRLIEEACDHMQPLAENRGLKLERRTPPSLPAMRVDKEKIISLLINLMGNAVKYTLPGGDIKLAVELQTDTVRIHVEDSGIGIPEDAVERIFERFYRCQDPRTADQVGNGLGLALAKEVALLHGGDLTVQSELNKGSRFTLHLPIQTA
jgi:signal transduction histidine kinase